MNTVWVLILTVSRGMDAGAAIDHIPGFTSQRACQIAASQWLKGAPRTLRASNFVTATCVRLTDRETAAK
jgi:hypothetical protein